VGNVYPRGQCVTVSAAAVEVLEKSTAADQFLFPRPAGTAASCCGAE
jgi:hypothetical protein